MRMQVGWDVSRIGTMTLRIQELVGPNTFNVSITSGRYAHEDLSSVMGSGEYTDFATALKAALEAESIISGNSLTYTVTYSTSALTYSISASSGTIALDFVTPAAAGTRMAQALGFAGMPSAAATQTSFRRGYYTIVPSLGARSRITQDYEQTGLISGAIAASGSHYSVSPTAMPVLYDFEQEFEYLPASTIAGAGTAVFGVDATTTVPWSYEAMWKHARAVEPFLVVDDNGSTVHTLRPEGAHFAPARRQVDWNQWDLSFQTYLEGRL